jgi:hypothetical protein
MRVMNLTVSKPLAVMFLLMAGFIGWMLSGTTTELVCNYDCPVELPSR